MDLHDWPMYILQQEEIETEREYRNLGRNMAAFDVESILNQLSVAEKCDLLAGIDFWHTKPLPKHGVPSLRLSDGPNGVRGTK